MEPPRQMGGGGRHLSLRLSQHGTRMRGVAFGQGERAEELTNPATPLAVAFRPVVNHFQGRRTVELHVVDWRPADAVAATFAAPAATAP